MYKYICFNILNYKTIRCIESIAINIYVPQIKINNN